MKKLSLLIVLCVTILSMTAPAYAASDVSDISARLTAISEKTGYKEGTKNDASYCWSFVNKVSKALFGVSIPNGTGGRYYLTGASSNKDWYLVDKAYGTDATNSAVVAVLKKAQAGDIIQYSNAATDQHTAMIYAVSDSGISIYDSCKPFDTATYQKVRIYTCTWDTILNWSWSKGMGNFGGTSGYGISLYRCNKNVVSEGATVSTTTADSITQTSAILRGSFATTGDCASECGMYIGTSKKIWKNSVLIR